jgi:hypothetical protein
LLCCGFQFFPGTYLVRQGVFVLCVAYRMILLIGLCCFSGKQPVRPSICIKSNTSKIICKCSWNIRSWNYNKTLRLKYITRKQHIGNATSTVQLTGTQ